MWEFGKRMLTIAVAVMVLLGVMGCQGIALAAEIQGIGVVDYGLLLSRHPDTQKANETIKVEAEQAKAEFQTKSAGLGDKEKQDLSQQLSQRVELKQRELLKAITDKINTAVKQVAEAKKLEIVVPKNIAIYGGIDITDEVAKKLH